MIEKKREHTSGTLLLKPHPSPLSSSDAKVWLWTTASPH